MTCVCDGVGSLLGKFWKVNRKIVFDMVVGMILFYFIVICLWGFICWEVVVLIGTLVL